MEEAEQALIHWIRGWRATTYDDHFIAWQHKGEDNWTQGKHARSVETDILIRRMVSASSKSVQQAWMVSGVSDPGKKQRWERYSRTHAMLVCCWSTALLLSVSSFDPLAWTSNDTQKHRYHLQLMAKKNNKTWSDKLIMNQYKLMKKNKRMPDQEKIEKYSNKMELKKEQKK